MSEQPSGYALTVLLWELGVVPSGVEGTPEDCFRITNPETGISVDWAPHVNISQARQVFWDLLPQAREISVAAHTLKRSIDATYQGWCMASHSESVRDEIYTYWGGSHHQSEAEALCAAACKAAQALQ